MRDELDYCLPLGIPHSIYLGRPWPQPGEPLWLDEDRRKAMEWQADGRDHCGQCGQRRSDWLDEKGMELRDPPFEVVETLCPACETLAMHQEDDQSERRPGVQFGFRRVKVEED